MILSDRDIKRHIEEGLIKIDPLPDLKVHLGSCSIDFRLGNKFRVFEHSRFAFIDPRDKAVADEITREVTVPDGETFVMQPGDFVLAVTMECLELPDNLLGRLEGRSSLGRLGIIVHGTASIFDAGWIGTPTMELGNLGRMPVALYPGMRICAFTFEELSSKADVPYRRKPHNKYAGQNGPLSSRITDEVE